MALDFRNSCLKNFNDLLIYNLRQRNCNINMVKKLLAHKVDVNYKDSFLNTSLHYVVQNCSDKLDLIREILNMEGNPNAVNAEGNSPLHLAVLKSNVHVILELIKFGGDVRLTNSRGNTPLHVAAMRGKPCIIETLLKSDATLINCGNIRENTPLHIAVIHGKPCAVEMLIRHEADVDCKNIDGNTPLHMAIIHNKEDIAKALIKAAADVNCANKGGDTPLHLSVANGQLSIVQILLGCGASVATRNSKGNTPLHLAVTHNRLDIVDVLIKFRADVGSPNNDLITAMHIAAMEGNSKLIRKLNDHGARVDCVDADGNTPLHLAIIHNRPSVIESLIVNGAEHSPNKNGYTPLHLAVTENRVGMIKLLLGYGADIDCKDAKHNTPLHLAAIHNNPDAVVKLIESGAKTDIVNLESHTPVQMAAIRGNVNIINVLFQNGVRVKLRNQGRRYISSFAQSLIQQSNATLQNAAAATNPQPVSPGAATGGFVQNQNLPPNPIPAHSGIGPTYSQYLSTITTTPIVPPGHPGYTGAGPSHELTHVATGANSLIQEMQQLLNSTPTTATGAAVASQSANVASTSHVVNVSSQTVQSLTQGSNTAPSQVETIVMSPGQDNILPVVAQTISEIASSMNSLGGLLPSPALDSNSPAANAFADLLFETEQAYVLGPISIAQPPTLQQSTTAQSGAAPPPLNTYVAFLDELDSEGDPMSWSWSPFLRNSRIEETIVIDNLVKFYGINGRNRSGNERLQSALILDDPANITALLQSHTGNVNKTSRRENSFLHLAVVYGRPRLVMALLRFGSLVDSKNNEMNTALHFAAFCGEADCIDILCRHGANLDLSNRRGATPLKYSFGYCRESVLRNLGQFGARRFLTAAKALVKYDVLKKGLYLTRHKVLKANCVLELFQFVEECCDEALKMKQKHLAKNFSFYQFVNQALSGSEPLTQHVEAAVDYLIEISFTNDYAIYYDIFVFLMTTKLDKSFWQKRFLDLVDKLVAEGKIGLNRRLFSSICNYVSGADIFNLLLAFTEGKLRN